MGQHLSRPGNDAGRDRSPGPSRHDLQDECRKLSPNRPRTQTRLQPTTGSNDNQHPSHPLARQLQHDDHPDTATPDLPILIVAPHNCAKSERRPGVASCPQPARAAPGAVAPNLPAVRAAYQPNSKGSKRRAKIPGKIRCWQGICQDSCVRRLPYRAAPTTSTAVLRPEPLASMAKPIDVAFGSRRRCLYCELSSHWSRKERMSVAVG